MAIYLTCDSCGQLFMTRDVNAGREAACPDCGQGLVVPKVPASGRDPLDVPETKTSFTSAKAILSFVLGLASLGCMFLAGFPAIVFGLLGLKEINRSRGFARGRVLATAGVFLGLLGSTFIPVIVLYPALKAWDDSIRRSQCTNQMKQIALALHNFHNVYGRFPPLAIRDKQGRPLLSWRVAILPYLGAEGDTLFRKFRLEEPWDGPNNRVLLREMPAVFACPNDRGAFGNATRYQAFVSPNGIFTGKRKGVSIEEITNGTSNTLMVVEMALPIPWTAPDDVAFDPTLPLGGMGSPHPGGGHAAFADGSVRFLGPNVTNGVLGALISRNSGQVVTPP